MVFLQFTPQIMLYESVAQVKKKVKITMQVVQQLAGHPDIATTRQYYLSVWFEDLAAASRLLNNILFKIDDY
jgi:integrase